MKNKLLFSLILSLAVYSASAQMYTERKDIRKGNALYEKGDFQAAEQSYRGAMEKAPGSYGAAYNLSNALYKQGRYQEAEQIIAPLAASDSMHVNKNSASAYYNTGNAQFQQRKLQEALESYKESLRRNPNDMEAKFNLAYVQKLLENDNNGGGGGDNQDQNKDQNQDQNQGDNDQNDDQQNQDQNDPGKDGDNDKNDQQDKGDNPQQEQQGGMDQQTADQLLDAMQAAEDETKEKVDSRKAVTVGRSGKNW